VDESARAKDRTLRLLDNILPVESEEPFAVRLWDGTLWPEETPPNPAFTLVLNHPGALRRMFLRPTELNLGQCFIYRDFDVEGDLIAAFRLADQLIDLSLDLPSRLRLAGQLLSLPHTKAPQEGRQAARLNGAVHSRGRDRQAIAYHYDVSNDFYALWLDRRMVYSCAYFCHGGEDLDLAQEQKLEHTCRKLRLAPGERLLDIGCGWGGLVIYAARHYGVQSVGITLSEPQVKLARARIREAGLEDRCRVDLLDYREVPEGEPFDKLVSVGMFEHVGESKLPAYFDKAWRLLRPEGLFLNHAIACTEPDFVGSRTPDSFSERYVFPDGELVPINRSLRAAETVGWEIRDVESLREHYALTLRHWARRLVERREEALACVDPTTYRVWRLFISGSADGFEAGRLNVYQSLLAKPGPRGRSGLPLTRRDLYVEQAVQPAKEI
jgi:cyclopropane-fatty-acyl-phospholipid synthase